MKTIIKNGTVVLPDKVRQLDIAIADSKISAIEGIINPKAADHLIDATGKYILPGFVDIHSNGAAGFDISAGLYDEKTGSFDLSEQAIQSGLQNAIKFYLKTGATSVLLSTISGPLKQLQQSLEWTAAYLSGNPANHQVLAGLYVEGTFMKDPAYRGAHNPDFFHPADPGIFDTLQSASDNRIRVVNVPPEHDAAGLELMQHLSRQDVIIAAGHTGATADQYNGAVEAGLSLAIHFLNGPTGSSTKPFGGGGAVEAILQSDAVSLELITDGYHVSKPYVRDTIERKGADRIAVITDCMFLTGLQQTKQFNMFGIDGRVSKNREYLQVADRETTLFGSVLTMDKAFSNLLTWLTAGGIGIWYRRHEPLPFEDALLTAAQMCSSTPAAIVRFTDRGDIAVGKRADLVLASIKDDFSGYHLFPESVFLNGVRVVHS